jgi:hypothetical protein
MFVRNSTTLHSTFKYLIAVVVPILFLSGCGTASDSNEESITIGSPLLRVDLASNNTSITYNGSVTLSWSTSNADNCTASGDWSGSKGKSGSQIISSLTANRSFTLSCEGSTETISNTVNVSVTSTPTPITVNLSSNTTSVAFNGSVTLSWSTGNADSCTASGDWSGIKGTSGSQALSLLTANRSFTLNCTGSNGVQSKTVNISVAQAPTPVTISLSSNIASVANNGSITLSWSSGNADSCTASGDWSGSKITSGSQTISSITSNSSYVLNCTGTSGTSNDTVNLTVINYTALLAWTPPTENTDNSALTDLTGYKIYYGTTSGSYSNTVTLAGTTLTSYLIENLSATTWYFTMTAYNSSGVESSYANETSKTLTN